MIYKFILVSDEEPDFMREISISSEAKFLELHEAILDSVNYDGGAITSFFICNDDWEKEQEITLIEMDTDSDVDSYVMSDTTISDLVTDEHQKLLYVFDFLSDRAFFIELKEMLPGQDIDAAECTASLGDAPIQYKLEDDIEDIFEPKAKGKKAASSEFDDESFYGDEGFNEDEFDDESFSDLNFDDDINSY
ncbi:MAG: hypothetical protein IKJ22_02775 [Paludibacteraceae bacterium]|nr:hypothetical protein [Paludibacteraceae bacterium]MBR3871649.1 hypothetical protein [Paludibacteraceae bacterium]MBR6687087.1 hypothetical protein [Paludibacteraceae bacterium]